MLWPGMSLRELMNTMEVYYGFRATEDQYKKKFKDWYKKGLLPPKKRQREGIRRETQKVIKACSSLRNGHIAPWSGSSPEESIVSTSAIDTGLKREDTQLVHIERQIDNLTVSEQPQQDYILQLNNLWDAHFDAEFGDAKLIDIQAAVESMIQFLATEDSFIWCPLESGVAILRTNGFSKAWTT
ncbi:hypothetical protein N0V86_000236 [Didymella sp. IMI 355093]|nr:hypothetical protein N0V86_000236 [Didymella sp. IMI 355093]